MGTSKLMILVPLFYLKFLGSNWPLVVQELHIGGTRFAKAPPGPLNSAIGLRLDTTK
jgi:hypothetical protein